MALNRSPLHDFHVAHGARMVGFAGWEMPVQYKGILDEHKAVRNAAGLFDVSHMGEVDVRGPGALAFLQHLLTNDLSKMTPGRVVYSPMCRADGGTIDDLLVYKRGDCDFFLCINAGNTAADLAWMREHAAGRQVEITDRSADYALLAVQGPRALEIVQALAALGERERIAALKYYHFAEGVDIAGARCLLSRTGYTGGDGFELYHSAGDARKLAGALLAAGAPLGLEPVGLGARDSLRLEAGFPLHGHEISLEISPVAAGLGWAVKLEKEGGFIGRDALLAESRETPRRVVFFKTGDRRIVRAGAEVLDSAGARAGTVLSGTFSPMLGEAIGSAIIGAGAAASPLFADIRGAKIALHLAKPPFVSLKK